MRHSRLARGAVSLRLLGLVLVALVGVGAWNYHRNLRLEEESRATRPFGGYATADLEALAAAYREEIAADTHRYENVRKTKSRARDRAYFGEQVQEFEKVQRESVRTRDAGSDLSQSEAALRDVETELAQRGPELSSWQQHWRRALRF